MPSSFSLSIVYLINLKFLNFGGGKGGRSPMWLVYRFKLKEKNREPWHINSGSAGIVKFSVPVCFVSLLCVCERAEL